MFETARRPVGFSTFPGYSAVISNLAAKSPSCLFPILTEEGGWHKGPEMWLSQALPSSQSKRCRCSAVPALVPGHTASHPTANCKHYF